MRISDYSLRNLRTFCAVAEHGGFGGAQVVLGVGPSVISTHLRDLEVTLGFTLCQRGRSGFALTQKGEAVYHEIKRMLSSLEACEANIGALRRVLSGHLRIGIVDSEADNPDLPVHRAIRRFFGRAQDVRLTLEVGTPEALGKGLQTGDIHVAIGPFPQRAVNIDYRPVYVERHELYCGRDHPLYGLANDDITCDRIARHPMTVRPYLQRAELGGLRDPLVTASVSNMEAQAILIRSGHFLGFLPVHFARKWTESGEMRAITSPGLGWDSQFYIAMRVQPEPTEITQRFTADLAAILGK